MSPGGDIDAHRCHASSVAAAAQLAFVRGWERTDDSLGRGCGGTGGTGGGATRRPKGGTGGTIKRQWAGNVAGYDVAISGGELGGRYVCGVALGAPAEAWNCGVTRCGSWMSIMLAM